MNRFSPFMLGANKTFLIIHTYLNYFKPPWHARWKHKSSKQHEGHKGINIQEMLWAMCNSNQTDSHDASGGFKINNTRDVDPTLQMNFFFKSTGKSYYGEQLPL